MLDILVWLLAAIGALVLVWFVVAAWLGSRTGGRRPEEDVFGPILRRYFTMRRDGQLVEEAIRRAVKEYQWVRARIPDHATFWDVLDDACHRWRKDQDKGVEAECAFVVSILATILINVDDAFLGLGAEESIKLHGRLRDLYDQIGSGTL